MAERNLFDVLANVDIADCWNWLGVRDRDGYGRTHIGSRANGTLRMVRPHRYVYEELVGPVGDLVIDHLCRNRLCCNPDHLEPVTAAENVRRGRAGYGKKNHCRFGHSYDDAYTWGGQRKCRTCYLTSKNKRKARSVGA